jgi:hypothetical protein
VSKSEINLDVDAPDKVTSVLTAAATAYPASAVEFSAAWQDRYIPMIWAAIASELDIAAWRRSSSTGSTGSIPQYGGKSNGPRSPFSSS